MHTVTHKISYWILPTYMTCSCTVMEHTYICSAICRRELVYTQLSWLQPLANIQNGFRPCCHTWISTRLESDSSIYMFSFCCISKVAGTEPQGEPFNLDLNKQDKSTLSAVYTKSFGRFQSVFCTSILSEFIDKFL